MVFRRDGRPSLYFQGKTETGYKQICTLAKEKALAVRIETMWDTLASTHRAWDVLGHHWAVRQLRAGTPIGVVQRQLGHATAKETLDTYGPFVPSGVDRAQWEQQATEHDRKRRAVL